VHAFELQSHGAGTKVALSDPDLIIDRAKLTRLLAVKALQAGAEIEFGWRFEAIELDRDQTLVKLRRRGGDQVRIVPARTVIGADGGRSDVAKALGQSPRQNVTVMQARVALPDGFDGGLSQVWFAPCDTRYFYWLIPESPRTAVVGIVDDVASVARPKLDRFLRAHNYEPIEYQGARIAMYGPTPPPIGRVGHANVYMVGDAAGQVKVTTVGGTVTGFWGARAVARAILRSSGYHRELRPVNRELHLHWLIRGLLNRFRDEHYSALLGSINRRLQRVLGAHNRDVMSGAFLLVLAAQPRLLLLTARTLAVREAPVITPVESTLWGSR